MEASVVTDPQAADAQVEAPAAPEQASVPEAPVPETPAAEPEHAEPEPVPGSITLVTGQTRDAADLPTLEAQLENAGPEDWVTVDHADGTQSRIRAHAIIVCA